MERAYGARPVKAVLGLDLICEFENEDIVAYQASRRGGTLHCHLEENGRIKISGEAALFAISDIQIEW